MIGGYPIFGNTHIQGVQFGQWQCKKLPFLGRLESGVSGVFSRLKWRRKQLVQKRICIYHIILIAIFELQNTNRLVVIVSTGSKPVSAGIMEHTLSLSRNIYICIYMYGQYTYIYVYIHIT